MDENSAYIPAGCPLEGAPCGSDGEGGCVACGRPRSDFAAWFEELSDEVAE